jgi:positive regulator of sigma E activity
MSHTPSRDPARHLSATSMHSLGYVLAAATLLVVGAVALTLAALYPITAMGVVALAGAGWYALRTFRRFYRTRRQADSTRTVCVPKVGVCLKL